MYLIKPCLHDLGGLLRKVASLPGLSMLVLIMAGHKESGDVSRVGILYKTVHRSRLLLMVTCAVAMFWVDISHWQRVTHSLMVWLRSGSLTVVRPRCVRAVSAGSRGPTRVWTLIWMCKVVTHLPGERRILHRLSEGVHSGEWLHHSRSRGLLWRLIVSGCFVTGPTASNSGRMELPWPRWAHSGVGGRDRVNGWPTTVHL